jgi:hypothetical protein
MGARIAAGAKRWFASVKASALIAQAVERWFRDLEPALIELTDPLCKRIWTSARVVAHQTKFSGRVESED